MLGLNYEIKCGPILWTKKQTNNTILIKKYGNPIGLYAQIDHSIINLSNLSNLFYFF